jgi:uncharacterized protein with HEPN domain
MRREHLYLHDIREACDMIQAFLDGLDASAFLASELHKAATLQKLTVIGEAAAHLSHTVSFLVLGDVRASPVPHMRTR